VKQDIKGARGCLGSKGRRRTWQAAKSPGRCLTTEDPGISEWGNPHGRKSMHRLVKIVAKRGHEAK